MSPQQHFVIQFTFSVTNSCVEFSSDGDIALESFHSLSMSEGVSESCITTHGETMDKATSLENLHEDSITSREENLPGSESVLVKVPPASPQGPGSDTAAEGLTSSTSPSQEVTTKTKPLGLSPQHSERDVSERASSHHLRMSTFGLTTPSLSEDNLSRPVLVVEDMSTEMNSGSIKSSCITGER